MYRHVIEVQSDIVEKCVKATCVLYNFLQRTTQTTAVRGSILVGEVEPPPGLGSVTANYSARPTSYFSAQAHPKQLFKSHPHITIDKRPAILLYCISAQK